MIDKTPCPHHPSASHLGSILIVPLRLYKILISPYLGSRCRFYPSCSQYAMECLQIYPFLKALKKISWRLLRCQPLHPGGVDMP